MKQTLSKTKHRVRRVSVILIVTVLSYVIFSVAGSVVAFQLIFPRTAVVNAFELTYDDIDQARYPREEISFLSGENRLHGALYRPKGERAGLVLVLNGANSCLDRHLPEILWFVDHGFCALTFENTGVGESEGAGTVGIAQARLDADAAVGYIQSDETLAGLPLTVYGHSLGGYAAATLLADTDRVCAAPLTKSGKRSRTRSRSSRRETGRSGSNSAATATPKRPRKTTSSWWDPTRSSPARSASSTGRTRSPTPTP